MSEPSAGFSSNARVDGGRMVASRYYKSSTQTKGHDTRYHSSVSCAMGSVVLRTRRYFTFRVKREVGFKWYSIPYRRLTTAHIQDQYLAYAFKTINAHQRHQKASRVHTRRALSLSLSLVLKQLDAHPLPPPHLKETKNKPPTSSSSRSQLGSVPRLAQLK